MKRLDGYYFDGMLPAAVKASLEFSGPKATLIAGLFTYHFDNLDIKVSPRIGSAPRFITFPNGRQFSCADTLLLDSLPQESGSEGLVAWLEERWFVALTCTVVVIAVLLISYFFGLPAASERIAARIPLVSEKALGQQALAWLDQQAWLTPSQLHSSAKERVIDYLQQLTHDLPNAEHYRLEFRKSKYFGPNALAFPGGLIIITDPMLGLTYSEEEMMAVLAHEIGHVELRHSLRNMLQNSVIGVAVTMVTSDTASLGAAMVGFPMLIAQTKYSRDFERAADEYAFRLLKQKGISPSAFAALMQRLLEQEKGPAVPSYLSTHPITKERIENARMAAATRSKNGSQ